MKKYLEKVDPVFFRHWQEVAPFTMTSMQRGFALWQAVNHTIDKNLPGCFVECGVWKGGSSMLIAHALLQRGATSRDIYLFDTFEGMTEPGTDDLDLHGKEASALMSGSEGEHIAELVRARSDIDQVRRAMLGTGYPPERLHFVKGDIRHTLTRTQTLKIALLRLDTDFDDSTSASLKALYPRVTKGGTVLIDDYGHWRGAKNAVDRYFASGNRVLPMLWPVDYTGRGFTKAEEPLSVEIERYDYVPPGFSDPQLIGLFPYAKPTSPWAIKWPYLRPRTPHIFRTDVRDTGGFLTGFASYEEATCLFNLARQFRGRRGLEIGTHYGWTGAHLLAAGLEMDFIDPAFKLDGRSALINQLFEQVGKRQRRELWPCASPEGLGAVRQAGSREPISFVFIDGDHSGKAPTRDAESVLPLCADDAMVVFHDMTSPDVAAGLAVFKKAGWSCMLLNTMQILGVALRGKVSLPNHTPDPNCPRILPVHLKSFPCFPGDGAGAL